MASPVSTPPATLAAERGGKSASLTALFENISDVVVLARLDGRIMMLNAAARQLLGWSLTDLNRGRSLLELVDEPSREILQRDALPSAHQQGRWTGPLALKTPQGARPTAVVLFKHTDRESGAPLLSLIGRDPSVEDRELERLREERLRAVEQLVSYRERLEETQELARLGSWEHDTTTKTTRWTRALFQIHELPVSSTAPPSVEYFERIHPEDRARVAAVIEHALRHGRTVFEYRYQLQSGELLHVRGLAESTVDADGVARRVRGMMQDVTADRRVHAELVEAREVALEASRAKSRFLANMSHEIRTPMNGVIGIASLLAETKLTAEQRQYVSTVQQSAEHLLHLINELLDLAKIEAGKFELHVAEFAPEEVVVACARELAPRCYAKGIELAVNVEPSVPLLVAGDRVRFHQVVTNLLSNAVKFTNVGHVQVSLALEDGDILHGIVSDTGTGIPADKLQTVFAPFVQLDDSSTRSVGGSGLGLAICQEVIHRIGGSIWVESKHGTGSDFHFALKVSGIKPRPATHPLPLADRYTLVMDPDIAVRAGIAGVVRSLGAMTAQCGDADVALAWIEGTPGKKIVILGNANAHDTERIEAAVIAAKGELIAIEPPGITRAIPSAKATVVKPVTRAALTAAVTPKPSESSKMTDHPAPVAAPSQRLRMLVVEDNDVNALLIMRALTKEGHDVTRAVNGELAVSTTAMQSFDVVWMDVNMPIMDGYEATRRIRAREQETGRRTKIIALTAAAMPSDAEKCREVGMDAFLSKPITLPRLRDALSSLVLMTPPVVPPPPAKATLDRTELLARVGGDETLARDLVNLFLGRSAKMLADVLEASRGDDLDALRRAAHAAKGACATISALDASTAAARVEGASAQRNWEGARAATKEFEAAMQTLRQELAA